MSSITELDLNGAMVTSQSATSIRHEESSVALSEIQLINCFCLCSSRPLESTILIAGGSSGYCQNNYISAGKKYETCIQAWLLHELVNYDTKWDTSVGGLHKAIRWGKKDEI